MAKYTATVDGIEVSANTPEELRTVVAQLRGIPAPKSEPKAKPKPKAATPAAPPAPKKPEKLSTEDFVKALQKDHGAAILSALSAQLGYDIVERMEALTGQVQAAGFIAARSSVVSALTSRNIKPTAENIQEVSNLLAAKEDRAPTLDNLLGVVDEALSEGWMKAEESPAPKAGKTEKLGNKEAPVPDGRTEAEPGGGRKSAFPTFDGGDNDDDDVAELVEFAETAPLDELQKMLASVPMD